MRKRGPTTLRSIRIPDELWDALLSKAEAEDTTASDVVRELISKWLTRPPRSPR
jgi:hypothetical protein